MAITVRQLIDHLKAEDQNKPVAFGSGLNVLTFYRIRDCGDYVQVEFDQNVFRDDSGQLAVQGFNSSIGSTDEPPGSRLNEAPNLSGSVPRS